MNGKAVMWVVLILVSAMTVGLVFLAACANEDDDVSDDDLDDDSDDDTDDDIDDDTDDDADDDTDDDIDDDTVINSCEEIPREGLGEQVSIATLVCDDEDMFSADAEWEDYMVDPQPHTLLITSQAELEAALPDYIAVCEIDFDESMVLGAVGYSAQGLCSSIEICGVYNDGEKITALVYWNSCHEDGPADTQTPYHFVTLDKTDLPVEFLVYEWSHGK